ncbi:MAG: serine/threonine protein kinase [Deltaproteobacteria bacterium]|nr:serine/threonine protein kinase [Deltaproteobacteria bacterium]
MGGARAGVEGGAVAVTGSSEAWAPGKHALHVDEVQRARGMGLLLGTLCLIAVVWFLFLGGTPWLRFTTMGALALLGTISLYVWRRAEPGERYVPLLRLFSGTAVFTSALMDYYIGVFSPAPIAVSLGISFFGTSDDRRWAVGCCLVAGAIYSITAALLGLGLIPDLGLIRVPDSPLVITFASVMVPLVFLGTLRQARLSRHTATQAMIAVDAAARVVQQREAQLAEANLDLEKALDVGGAAKLGRHTGRVAGSWVLGDVIGRGAMGEVYAARHENGHTTAAVKMLMATADGNQLARFYREALIATKLRAPGLVSVFEVGALDNEVPYLVMELLQGHDLAWHLRKKQHLELPEVVAMCTQVAAGLRDAHAAGIVHRDIKPQNLFLHTPTDGGAPSWKILDFGISKLQDGGDTLTQNLVVGTPGYMSPEQARGQAADARSDLFSLGAVLYRALTGQPPFRGNDTPQTLFDVVYRGPRRPTELMPGMSRDLDLFLAIALAKSPEQRFTSATELARALAAAASGGLSAELRARGEILLLALPWGSRQKH